MNCDTGPDACRAAMRRFVEKCCTTTTGKRSCSTKLFNPDEKPNAEVLRHFTCAIRTLVCDGGPSENRAVVDASPTGGLANPEMPGTRHHFRRPGALASDSGEGNVTQGPNGFS